MKLAMIGIAAALCVGCSQTPDEQFEAMYHYQKQHDPKMAASTAELYQYRSQMSDEEKMMMVRAYDDVKKHRARVQAMSK